MWNKFAICKCGYYVRAPFGDKYHIHKEVCPDCGESKDEWSVRVAKETSDSKWYNPFTWSDSHLELKED